MSRDILHVTYRDKDPGEQPRFWSGFISKALIAHGVIVVIAIHIAAFIAYYVYEYDTVSGEMFDGWGRTLYPAPLLARLLGAERLWPGLLWFLGDIAIYFGSLAIAVACFKLATFIHPEKSLYKATSASSEEWKKAFDPDGVARDAYDDTP